MKKEIDLDFNGRHLPRCFSFISFKMEEQHLQSLLVDSKSDSDVSICFDSDSDVEITSSIDDSDHELVSLSTYLRIESEDEDDQWANPPSPLSSLSSDVEESNDSQQVNKCQESITDLDGGKCSKHKRRRWIVKEKLDIIASYGANKNKRQTANKEGCTTAQLRKWIKDKDKLMNIHRKKNGKFLFSHRIRHFFSY